MKKKLLEIPKGKTELEVEEINAIGINLDYSLKDEKISTPKSGKEIPYPAYFIDVALVDAVNAAIVTGRPLLLKGAPGCGKTKLAAAVAAKFHDNEFLKYYFEWHVKSRSKAKDGAYTFDHVNRLRDSTVAKSNEDSAKVKDAKNYISLGPLGYSFCASHENDKQIVLLIDEIDKGDIDFPNDLLLELDELRFAINELEEKEKYISANDRNKPLVIITSNDERDLPPAFLRRCLYYKIPPFESDLLIKIVNKKLSNLYKSYNEGEGLEIEETVITLEDKDVEAIVQKFLSVSELDIGNKKPSTSELLDWLKIIVYRMNVKKEKPNEIIDDGKLHTLALKITD